MKEIFEDDKEIKIELFDGEKFNDFYEEKSDNKIKSDSASYDKNNEYNQEDYYYPPNFYCNEYTIGGREMTPTEIFFFFSTGK